MRPERALALLALALMLAGCGPRSLSPEAYRDWIADPGCPLRARFEAGGLTYEALYKPLEYVAFVESKNPRADEKSYAGLQYFGFWIKRPGFSGDLLKAASSGDEDYSRRLLYCMSAMEADVHVEEEGARYPCRLFHHPRTHGLTPCLAFVMAFERPADELEALRKGLDFPFRDKTLVFRDGLFGNGAVHLVVKGEELRGRPRLDR